LEINFYQVLNLKPFASQNDVHSAFHQEAVQYHPDQFSHDPELKDLALHIYERIVDAYRTLSHEEKRKDYDFRLQGGESNPDPNTKTAPSTKPKTPGSKFSDLAKRAFSAGDFNAAKMNIQIALTQDPDNLHYQHLKVCAEEKFKKQKEKLTGSDKE
jgi:DnaJ-class molecular chaperone